MRVLVAHESARVRARIRRLSDRFEACDVAVSGSDAVTTDRVGTLQPRLILLSATLAAQHADGLARIVTSPAQVPAVIVATPEREDEGAREASAAVLGGYLAPTAADEIAAMLRAFSRESVPRDLLPASTRVRPDEGSSDAPSADGGELTAVEREVLAGLAGGATAAGMADAMGLTEAAIDGHVTHVLTKLHRRGTPAARS